MVSYITKRCRDCEELISLKSEVEKKIYEQTKYMYFSSAYMSDAVKVCKSNLKMLILYRDILDRMQYDSGIYEDTATRKEIISQIKKLLY